MKHSCVHWVTKELAIAYQYPVDSDLQYNLKPCLNIVVTVAESACHDAPKRILRLSTYRLQIFLLKDKYL